MKLIPITDRTACIDGVTMTTVYLLPDGGCILLDPGHPHDEEKLDALLEKENLVVRGILSTHAHHDHFGNCRHLAEKYHLPVILPIGEAASCRSPEAASTWLGFRSSFRVKNSRILSSTLGPIDIPIGFDQTSIEVAGETFRILHTPGHTIDCVSFLTPDNVLVVGDVLFSEDILSKMRAPYTSYIEQDIASKRLIGRTKCDWCVMGHRGYVPGSALPELSEKNIRLTEDVVRTVRSLFDHPMGMDEIIPRFCEARGIYGPTPLHGMQMRHIVSGVVGYLLDRGEIVSDTLHGLTHFIPSDGVPPTEDDLSWEGNEVQGK